jgi:hypothetical protein
VTVEPPPSRLQIARRPAAHFGDREFDQFVGLLSKDVTYRVGGNHALAGTFHEPEQVTGRRTDVVDRTGNTYDTCKWEDWLVGEHEVGDVIVADVSADGVKALLALDQDRLNALIQRTDPYAPVGVATQIP